ncbi:cysteine desulfurase family protein [Streptococcus sp. CSL10205-OR2]|uniref:cysteine desulfurase family protein n=1 Tax=Streptococcus sp. CSL10205-OR2 TaxID=2980558 RepID=UPI0021DA8D14|nr:cysteine desulfurase family protein [Streptococcus sp. CSL10205-OR2]MCU9533632.1 cysteine desulfurase [Streptococcus sp. CSL10205-OR2]
MIYFDNAATTMPYPDVLKTYQEVAQKIIGNPSSLHQLGSQASRILEAARKQIADLIGKEPDEIFFTSGGTESDNWVIKGVALEKMSFGKHIIISSIEHPAVTESAKSLEKLGFEIDYAPVDKNGFVIVEKLAELLRKDTILVSIMAINNEIGAIQPIQEIASLLTDWPKISFHVDAVQAIGKLDTALFLPDRVDYASFSGHKFHAMRGVGFIYKKDGKMISPLLSGGGQEKQLRSTTENVPAIVAMAKALRLVMDQKDIVNQNIKHMKEVLYQALKDTKDVVLFSGNSSRFSPHILTFGIKGIRGEVLVHAFEEHDIYLSTTSACSSRAGKIAGTLISMGIETNLAQTAVRISLSDSNNMAEIEQFLTVFHHIYEKMEKVRG